MSPVYDHAQRKRDTPISVVFVHGTWASGSRWPFVEAEILRVFGTEHIDFHYLRWSGRNSVSARLSAAEQLAHVLETDVENRPAHRFIVAHSHGGTVALLAARQPAIRQMLAGVICLSTPFLLARRRHLSDQGYGIAMLGAVLLGVASTVSLAVMLRSIALLFVGPVLGWALLHGVKRWSSRVPGFLDAVRLPDVTGLPLLIVRTPDDEASLSLAGMQGANRLAWLIWRFVGLHWVAVAWSRARRLAARVKAEALLELAANLWVLALIGSFFGVRILEDAGVKVSQSVLLALWLPVVLIALTVLVAAVLVLPVAVVNLLVLLPFGPAFSLFSPFLEVSVESTPPGLSTVAQLSWEGHAAIVETGRPYQDRAGKGWIHRLVEATLDGWSEMRSSSIRLQHSETYGNRMAIEAVVRWMKDRVAEIDAATRNAIDR